MVTRTLWQKKEFNTWKHPEHGKIHYTQVSDELATIKYHLYHNDKLIEKFMTKINLDKAITHFRRTHK